MKKKKFNKLTKIVATLGPASDSKTTIEKLIRNGVNVFRFNTKHGTPEWHEKRIQLVQQIADEMKRSIGILIDLQGPEIRIETKDQEEIILKKGQEILMSESFTDGVRLVIPFKAVFDVLDKDDEILIDDGKHALVVKEILKNFAILHAKKDMVINHRKGVNLPGKVINLPSLIKADLMQLDMAALNKVDFVALSFVRDDKDIKALKKEMQKRGIVADVVSKIENQEAVRNIDSIIAESEAIMVARGDLGVEVPIEKLLFLQKEIIKKCRTANKPVITATEMLDSMITRPRPTRAEATDVSNAVYEGTDAVMLSGETASGLYPVDAVEMMARICKYTESVRVFKQETHKACDATQLIASAAMQMFSIEGVQIDKIVTFTQTGYTARVLSAYRAGIPIIAITNNQKTVEKLCLSHGVFGKKYNFPTGKLVSPEKIIDDLARKHLIKKGETILVIHGARWKTPGLTNTITLITH